MAYNLTSLTCRLTSLGLLLYKETDTTVKEKIININQNYLRHQSNNNFNTCCIFFLQEKFNGKSNFIQLSILAFYMYVVCISNIVL